MWQQTPYKAQKMTQGCTQKRDEAGRFLRKDQNGPFGSCENTAQKIATDFKVGEQTVKLRRLLYGRHVTGETWEKIAESMAYSVRNMQRLHSIALDLLELEGSEHYGQRCPLDFETGQCYDLGRKKNLLRDYTKGLIELDGRP